jgi:DNA-binding IclR family transcriptional regulator
MTMANASIELAATRHEHVLTDTGTLLVGAATIVVPVAEDAAQVLETLSAEQPAEEQRSPSSFGPNRVRKGTRPGSTRSAPG